MNEGGCAIYSKYWKTCAKSEAAVGYNCREQLFGARHCKYAEVAIGHCDESGVRPAHGHSSWPARESDSLLINAPSLAYLAHYGPSGDRPDKF